jgi:hypothetical protein
MLDGCSMLEHLLSGRVLRKCPLNGKPGGMAHVSQIELGCRRQIEAQHGTRRRRVCSGPYQLSRIITVEPLLTHWGFAVQAAMALIVIVLG